MADSAARPRSAAHTHTAKAAAPIPFDERSAVSDMDSPPVAASELIPDTAPRLAIARPEEATADNADDGDGSLLGSSAAPVGEHGSREGRDPASEIEGGRPWIDETGDAADLISEQAGGTVTPIALGEPGAGPDGDEADSDQSSGPGEDLSGVQDIILQEPRDVSTDARIASEVDEDDADEQATEAHDEAVTTAEATEPAPTVTGKPMPTLPRRGEIAHLGVRKPGVAPRRIGSGRLVSARLTWKPGDPFAGSKRPERNPFRWEVMLTSACITAACGLGCIWLLRTILA